MHFSIFIHVYLSKVLTQLIEYIVYLAQVTKATTLFIRLKRVCFKKILITSKYYGKTIK